MSITRALPFLLLIAGAVGIALAMRKTRDEAPPARPINWSVSPPADQPRGEAFRVIRASSSPAARWKGTYTFEQSATGRFGGERTIPSRLLTGTFSATEAMSGPADAEEGAVDASFDFDEGGPASPTKRLFHAKLSFMKGADGLVVHRSIHLDAPPDVTDALEVFQFAWTQRFFPPDRPIRAGERLAIDDCVELDDAFRRPLWFLFKDRAAKSGPVSEPVEGGAWIETREGGMDGVARLRAALTHAHTGPTGPEGPSAVLVDYRAVLDGDRTIGLADGMTRRHALMLARRIHYTSRDLDYVVVVRGEISMEQDAK